MDARTTPDKLVSREVARWRLTSAHYLNVPGTEWEQKETHRETGRQVRKLYPVPLLLDPKDQADWNYPGEIIVAYEGSKYPRDLIFTGLPTPDMEPLNEAAEAISVGERARYKHPIDSIPGDYGQQVLTQLTKQLDAIISERGIPKAENAGAIPSDAFAQLQQQVAELMAKNIELEGKLNQRRL